MGFSIKSIIRDSLFILIKIFLKKPDEYKFLIKTFSSLSSYVFFRSMFPRTFIVSVDNLLFPLISKEVKFDANENFIIKKFMTINVKNLYIYFI